MDRLLLAGLLYRCPGNWIAENSIRRGRRRQQRERDSDRDRDRATIVACRSLWGQVSNNIVNNRSSKNIQGYETGVTGFRGRQQIKREASPGLMAANKIVKVENRRANHNNEIDSIIISKMCSIESLCLRQSCSLQSTICSDLWRSSRCRIMIRQRSLY